MSARQVSHSTNCNKEKDKPAHCYATKLSGGCSPLLESLSKMLAMFLDDYVMFSFQSKLNSNHLKFCEVSH